jgi:hypothetical protein
VKNEDNSVIISIRGRKEIGETVKGLRGVGKKEIVYHSVSASLFHQFLSLPFSEEIVIFSAL